MGRKVSLVVVLAAGFAIGLFFSGVFRSETPPELRAVESAAPAQSPEELAALREFAGKLETLFQTVANTVSPAVVLIESEQTVRVPAFEFRTPFDGFLQDFLGEQRQGALPGPGQRQRELKRQGIGSGFILDQEGHIVTNNHVVAGAEKVKVTLSDGSTFNAKVVGSDEKTDLAVIRIEGSTKGLPTVKLGDSDKAKMGQWVIAIGNPFGLRHTVSAGIISATGRSGLGIAEYESLIQTDAAINPGNSGGPLVNLECEVIGINTAIMGRGGNLGIGFAIPINMFRDVEDDLLKGQEVVRGYMGVEVRDLVPDMAEAFHYKGTEGALVEEVVEGSPAAEAKLQMGDIITEFDGRKVMNANDLRRRVAATKPGTGADFKVWRNGNELTLQVTLADRAAAEEMGRDWLGLQVQTLTPEMARNMGRPGLEGVLVADVAEDSLVRRYIGAGDVIVSVNLRKVASAGEYLDDMQRVKPGATVPLRVLDAQSGRAQFLAVRRPVTRQ